MKNNHETFDLAGKCLGSRETKYKAISVKLQEQWEKRTKLYETVRNCIREAGRLGHSHRRTNGHRDSAALRALNFAFRVALSKCADLPKKSEGPH